MEHRQGSRLSVKLHVDIWQKEKMHGSYCTTNLSSGGLFIERVFIDDSFVENSFEKNTPPQKLSRITLLGETLSQPSYPRDTLIEGTLVTAEINLSPLNLNPQNLSNRTDINTAQSLYRFKALPIHISDEGIGLMWAELDPSFQKELYALISPQLTH